jgi:dihydrofolate synthase/folylpolyglutamate synthase
MNYQETLNYMFTQLPMFQRTGKAAYKANLDNTLALDKYFNHPHTKFKSIHVAGTNGKGSVSHSVASVLQEAGYKVGLYTSPHLRDFRERIKINGAMISEQDVVDFIEDHKAKFEQIKPSFFEMTVALAFDYFAKMEVDIAVIEVGLGGRLDSTNIIDPILSVITNISLDHTNLLGTEVSQIAVEKAGIIKANVPVVVGEKQDVSSDIFVKTAKERGTTLNFAEERYSFKNVEYLEDYQRIVYDSVIESREVELKSDLLGQYQQKNIRTALCAIEKMNEIGFSIGDEIIKKGISNIVGNTGLLGRWQYLSKSPKVICDTGHNLAGIKEILEQINRTDYRKLHVVFGMVDDKNIDDVLKLMPSEATYYFTKASIPRALDETLLSEKAKAFHLEGDTYKDVETALKVAKSSATKEDLIFVGGSTFVVAEVV